MSEFLSALSAGWHQYADSGMYIGVFFAAMLFLWLVYGKRISKESEKAKLYLYSLGITLSILFPVTAFILLKYQTAFFTYSHLFLLIPMLPVVAWAMTEFVTWVREEFITEKKNPSGSKIPLFLKKKPWLGECAAVILLGLVLWMAGSLSFANEPTAEAVNGEKIPAEILRVLQILQEDEAMEPGCDVIVAPEEVLEYARAYSADLKLLYGRNMWQKELNAFTYDIYPAEVVDFYQWFSTVKYELRWVKTEITTAEAAAILVQNNCNVLVLTKAQLAEEEIAEEFGKIGFKTVEETEGYVILKR